MTKKSNISDEHLQHVLDLCSDNLSYSSILISGNENGLKIFKALYERVSQNPAYLCTFHDASKIKSAKDFFVPILKSKYGDGYDDVLSHLGDTVENILDAYDSDSGNNGTNSILSIDSEVHYIIKSVVRNPPELCDVKKRPLIFIEGIEELFFNFFLN